jgi:SAM-dependent methyltransferase
MATGSAVPVHPDNTGQFRAWDGDEGRYWAAHADHFERGLAAYRDGFMAAAAITPGAHVLDVGCGTGHTTRDAARAASAGFALGVDLSSAMLAVARQRASAAGLTNIGFEQADAQIHRFEPGRFDVVLAHCAAMFFSDRVAALANVGRALRPGGRLVLLTWQPFAANEWIREISGALAVGRNLAPPPPEAPGPFSLADPEVIDSVLTAAGYRDVTIVGTAAPMWFGRDADDAFRVQSGLMAWMLDGLDDSARSEALANLRGSLAAHETTEGVLYESATWTVHATWS